MSFKIPLVSNWLEKRKRDQQIRNLAWCADLKKAGFENVVFPCVVVGETLYRDLKPGVKMFGDGGAIDALKHEFLTGDKIGGKSHLQKVKDAARGLSNLLNGNTLNSADRSKAEVLFNKATEVLKGGGVE